jgi:hypothetical protein
VTTTATLTPPTLSERGSMILPVTLADLGPALAGAPEKLALGLVELTRKAELHATIINFALGKHLAKVCAARAGLREAIDAAAAAWPWRIEAGDVLFHLAQTAPGKEALDTVVALVEAPIAAFYGRLREVVAASGPAEGEGGAVEALLDGLAQPLPPHVTLYTSDPVGRAGIGLNTVAELELAVARAAWRDGVRSELEPALRAYRLHPSVLRLRPE